jgi:hypothetical protein
MQSMITREIHLPSGHIAIIDEADWDLVKACVWHANVSKRCHVVYAHTRVLDPLTGRRQHVTMHRLIFGAAAGQRVDHINHDGLDNRRENLRLCTASGNGANSRLPVNNTSGYKGVRRERDRWMAAIGVNGKTIRLGTFDDKRDAAQAYNAACIAAFGEFALPNAGVPTEPIARTPLLRQPRWLAKSGKSGYRGVTWVSHAKRWRANCAGKYLGYFDDPWDAALAFNTASRIAYGYRAYQNERHPEPG